MPRYATGTFHGSDYELYSIDDHANDAVAVRAFLAQMKESHPDIDLVPCDPGLDAWEFVARVADDFPLTADTITDDDIVGWVEYFASGTDDDEEAA